MSVPSRIAKFMIMAVLAASTASLAEIAHPIRASDLMTTAQLNRQLPQVKAGKIILIQVGFRMMYKLGHIPGSQYGGSASNPEGLAALEKLVAKLPRRQEIVIYCGCCPWDDCPNVRPAFQALKAMGFSNLKVLDIPQRLGTDWSAKGFPTVRGE